MATKAKNAAAKHKQAPDKKKSSKPKSAAPKPKSGRGSSEAAGKARPKREGTDKARRDKVVEAESDADARRKLGIRGAAPWAARHAAKHAAEARARAAEPPPPGSARATLRSPTGAEEIKARIIDLHNAMVEIKNQRRNLQRNFFTVGHLLQDIRDRKLYEARGFGSFETFLDREVDLGKTTALKLVLVVEVFHREAAESYGMDRVLAALGALESKHKAQPAMHASATGASARPPLPMRPPTPNKPNKK